MVVFSSLPIKILWHVSRVESIFFTNSFTRRKLNKRNKTLQLKKKRKEVKHQAYIDFTLLFYCHLLVLLALNLFEKMVGFG